TSHDSGQLTTAHVDHLTLDAILHDWQSSDIGAVGVAGAATEKNGVWTVTGAGGDIWGPADAFHFLRRSINQNAHMRVRVNDLQNTNVFAKAGVMLRATTDPDSPAVILDAKPDGSVEFMARTAFGGDMTFLDGLPASPGPVWLDLSWSLSGGPPAARASVSKDGVNWMPLGYAPAFAAPSLLAGIAVTSHDTSHATTAHVQALSLLPMPGYPPGADPEVAGALNVDVGS